MSDIRDQLVWNRLLAIVEEQAQTLMRTAFSTVVREAGDLSAGVFDTHGQMLAQAVTGTPGHVNAMAAAVGKFLSVYPFASLVPGDVLITNDPWDGTGHLNDFTAVTPVFNGDDPVGLFAATSHIADVGGRGFGPDAGDLYEEGLRIPIMKLFDGGVRNETLMRIIADNVRDPVVAEGDLYSLTACNRGGGEQLLSMMREFGLPGIDGVGRWIVETSRHAMAEEIRALPDGVYRYAMDVDGYDTPVHIACALTVAGDTIDVDFAGTSGLSAFGINVPLNYTEAYASFGVRVVVGNDIPNNAGSLEPVAVRAPSGLHPERRAAGSRIRPPCPGADAPGRGPRLPRPGRARRRAGRRRVVHLEPGSALRPDGNGQLHKRAVRHQPDLQRRHRRARHEGRPVHHGIPVGRPHHADRGQRSDRAARHPPPRVPARLGRGRAVPRRLGSSHRDRARRGRAVRDLQDVRPDQAPRTRTARRRSGSGRARLHQGRTELRGKGQDVVPPGATLVMETPGGGGIGPAEKRDSTLSAADNDAGLV